MSKRKQIKPASRIVLDLRSEQANEGLRIMCEAAIAGQIPGDRRAIRAAREWLEELFTYDASVEPGACED